MARTYKRDSRGRFAGGGGGGGSKKAAAPKAGPSKGAKMFADAAGGRSATKKANAAEYQRLTDKGVRGIGGRLQKGTASKFSGAKKTKAMAAGFLRGKGIASSARVSSTVSRKR